MFILSFELSIVIEEYLAFRVFQLQTFQLSLEKNIVK